MTQEVKKKKRSKIGFAIIMVLLSLLAVATIVFCAGGVLEGRPSSWVFLASADAVCMLIAIFILMGTLYGRETLGGRYKVFLSLVITDFLALFMDFSCWALDGRPEFRDMVMFCNTGIFIANQFLTVFFIRLTAETLLPDERKKRNLMIAMDAILTVTVLLRLLNVRYGFFFTVGEDAVYRRGPYYNLIYLYPLLGQIIVLYLVFRYSKDKLQKRTVLVFTLVPFAAMIVTLFVYGFSTIYPVVLLSIVTAYTAFFRTVDSDLVKIRTMFGRFVSKDVVEQLEKNRDSDLVPGKRYYATFFVSDLRGFTALAENMEPQPLVQMLNHYFGVAADVISSYGGIITEFLGDGLLCVFGAPTQLPDHAERCVAAALKLQEKMPEINRWNKEHGFPDIETGIGINTGNVIMGSLGNEKRARYMAVGEDVDRAFAIEGCSLGGQVLASGATVKAIKSPLELRFLLNYAEDSEQLVKIPIYDVRHIGEPWNVGRKRNYDPQRKVKEPIDIRYYEVNGKHTDVTPHDTTILKLSKDVAILKNDGLMVPLDNIRLEIPEFGTIFAKVTSVRPETVMVAFTSRPEGFAEWADSVTETEEPKYSVE